MANDRASFLTGNDPKLRDIGLALLRIILGVVFFAHGYLKFFKMGMDGVVGFFTSLGIPAPTVADSRSYSAFSPRCLASCSRSRWPL